MSEAQLVISRSGASSVADISVIGRPSILVPYPHAAGDHQSANARGLAQSGGAIVIPEAMLSVNVMAEQIATVLGNSKGASLMAQAALSVGKPEATDELVALVERLAEAG